MGFSLSKISSNIWVQAVKYCYLSKAYIHYNDSNFLHSYLSVSNFYSWNNLFTVLKDVFIILKTPFKGSYFKRRDIIGFFFQLFLLKTAFYCSEIFLDKFSVTISSCLLWWKQNLKCYRQNFRGIYSIHLCNEVKIDLKKL